MRCLVTGAAGFIGSHLCERLLTEGHQVVGVDAFIPYYPRSIKENNLIGLLRSDRFQFEQCDLRTDPLDELLEGIDVVFHLAAMAGLPRSWTDFALYESCNIAATQRLAAAAAACENLNRFVYASTSSVYGRHANGDESMPTRPVSPYGVTKLAAEQLCNAYADEAGLPLIVLRYFSVYGPRQRPDMGYHKFIDALLHDKPITVFGDGLQMRGNTYIDDCINATVATLQAPIGKCYNVGGGETASVWDILKKLEAIIGRKPRIVEDPARPGDQRHTGADTSGIRRDLQWRPVVGLEQGLKMQVDWQRQLVPLRKAA